MAIEAREIGAGLDPAVAERPPATASAQPSLRRRVVGLAGPVIGENLLETMLGIVDTVLVAHLGATEPGGGAPVHGAHVQVIAVADNPDRYWVSQCAVVSQ